MIKKTYIRGLATGLFLVLWNVTILGILMPYLWSSQVLPFWMILLGSFLSIGLAIVGSVEIITVIIGIYHDKKRKRRSV